MKNIQDQLIIINFAGPNHGVLISPNHAYFVTFPTLLASNISINYYVIVTPSIFTLYKHTWWSSNTSWKQHMVRVLETKSDFNNLSYIPNLAFLSAVLCLISLVVVGNKAKGRISKRVFQENKARQIFRKTNIFYPQIRTRTWLYKLNFRSFCISLTH